MTVDQAVDFKKKFWNQTLVVQFRGITGVIREIHERLSYAPQILKVTFKNSDRSKEIIVEIFGPKIRPDGSEGRRYAERFWHLEHVPEWVWHLLINEGELDGEDLDFLKENAADIKDEGQ
jgi:hypothetical protein